MCVCASVDVCARVCACVWRPADLGAIADRRPVLQQQRHHVGVTLLGGEVQRREATLKQRQATVSEATITVTYTRERHARNVDSKGRRHVVAIG